ncbi:hypothetical protein MRX96_058146 [Rhipicephalus microplus]
MGWSSFVAREAVANATYEKRFRRLPSANHARQVWVPIISASCSTRWARPTRSLWDPDTICPRPVWKQRAKCRWQCLRSVHCSWYGSKKRKSG